MIGLISPPVGMNAFVVQQVFPGTVFDVIKGSLPFLFGYALVLLPCRILPATDVVAAKHNAIKPINIKSNLLAKRSMLLITKA
jgi:TRAP-type C4-dicarboxylate transport system permease large subunit